MRLTTEKALRITAGIMLASLVGSAPWVGGRMDRAHESAKLSVKALSDAEIDAIPVAQPVSREQAWSDYKAYWAQPTEQSALVQATEEIASAIRAAAAQVREDNLTAEIWRHSR